MCMWVDSRGGVLLLGVFVNNRCVLIYVGGGVLRMIEVPLCNPEGTRNLGHMPPPRWPYAPRHTGVPRLEETPSPLGSA